MFVSIEQLLKWFPVKLPSLVPPHRYEGKYNGVNRPVESLVIRKHLALDNVLQVTVKYPSFRDDMGVEWGAIRIDATYHALDSSHIPEQVQVDGKDVLGDRVNFHAGVKLAMPPEPWVAFSFRWEHNRADVRAYIKLI